MIFWGTTKQKKQRYRCQFCHTTGIKKRSDLIFRNKEVLFERWLLKTETLERLAKSRHTKSSAVVKHFDVFWKKKVVPTPYTNNESVILVDGILLERNSCILIAIDRRGFPITWLECVRENTTSWKSLFLLIRKQIPNPSVIVSDGQKGLIRAIQTIFPTIPHQRCMTHVVRLAHAWLTRNPQTDAGKELRKIVGDLYQVHTKDDAKKWNEKFNEWQKRHHDFLKEKSFPIGKGRPWYTHRKLRAVRSLVLGALPELFTFLEVPNTPRTTNKLEGGVNSPIKALIRHHRGMKLQHRQTLVFRFLRARQYRNTNTKC
jgi:hypothetical protein